MTEEVEKILFQRDTPPRLNRLRDQGNKVIYIYMIKVSILLEIHIIFNYEII